MPSEWFRLSIDLDSAGQPLGTSWEAYVDDRRVSYGTGPLPGPFDTARDAYDLVWYDHVKLHGLQGSLFPG